MNSSNGMTQANKLKFGEKELIKHQENIMTKKAMSKKKF